MQHAGSVACAACRIRRCPLCLAPCLIANHLLCKRSKHSTLSAVHLLPTWNAYLSSSLSLICCISCSSAASWRDPPCSLPLAGLMCCTLPVVLRGLLLPKLACWRVPLGLSDAAELMLWMPALAVLPRRGLRSAAVALAPVRCVPAFAGEAMSDLSRCACLCQSCCCSERSLACSGCCCSRICSTLAVRMVRAAARRTARPDASLLELLLVMERQSWLWAGPLLPWLTSKAAKAWGMVSCREGRSACDVCRRSLCGVCVCSSACAAMLGLGGAGVGRRYVRCSMGLLAAVALCKLLSARRGMVTGCAGAARVVLNGELQASA